MSFLHFDASVAVTSSYLLYQTTLTAEENKENLPISSVEHCNGTKRQRSSRTVVKARRAFTTRAHSTRFASPSSATNVPDRQTPFATSYAYTEDVVTGHLAASFSDQSLGISFAFTPLPKWDPNDSFPLEDNRCFKISDASIQATFERISAGRYPN